MISWYDWKSKMRIHKNTTKSKFRKPKVYLSLFLSIWNLNSLLKIRVFESTNTYTTRSFPFRLREFRANPKLFVQKQTKMPPGLITSSLGKGNVSCKEICHNNYTIEERLSFASIEVVVQLVAPSPFFFWFKRDDDDDDYDDFLCKQVHCKTGRGLQTAVQGTGALQQSLSSPFFRVLEGICLEFRV